MYNDTTCIVHAIANLLKSSFYLHIEICIEHNSSSESSILAFSSAFLQPLTLQRIVQCNIPPKPFKYLVRIGKFIFSGGNKNVLSPQIPYHWQSVCNNEILGGWGGGAPIKFITFI